MTPEWSDSFDKARAAKYNLPQMEPRSITAPVPKGCPKGYVDKGSYIYWKGTEATQKMDEAMDKFGVFLGKMFMSPFTLTEKLAKAAKRRALTAYGG